MKWKKSGNTERRNGELNTWYTGKIMGMNMINRQQKQGYLMQKG